MDKSREGVEEGVTIAHIAGTALERIEAAIESSVSDLRRIITTTDEEVAKSELIIKLVDSTSSVMELTDEHVQSLAASMEETAAAMESVATSSQEVSETSEELRLMAERFKVDREERHRPCGIDSRQAKRDEPSGSRLLTSLTLLGISDRHRGRLHPSSLRSSG
jgi:hypothetical protein